MHVMREKRNGTKPVPDNFMEFLNHSQLLSLRKVESFGWQLLFIRRPLFLEPTIVVADPDSGRKAVLEECGKINQQYQIVIR